MPYKINKDGTTELSGLVLEWYQDFKAWYTQDFGNNPKIEIGYYMCLLIINFIKSAKEKWQDKILTHHKAWTIARMVTNIPNGVSLTDPYAALDYLAENLSVHERNVWSKPIRDRIVKQFNDIPTVKTQETEPAETEKFVKNVQCISALNAIQKADRFLNSSEWQIAFLSNTGVTSTVSSQGFSSPAQALMLPVGEAGQWVVEFFKDSPIIFLHEGKEGLSYPFRRVLVTASETSELPESNLRIFSKLMPLKPDFLKNIDSARELAILKNTSRYDVVSVFSEVKSNGDCFWRFRFYDSPSGNIVNKICVTGDGTKICPW